jgi:uncharacterized SAM-binding protein YcdF (DUF218 family)
MIIDFIKSLANIASGLFLLAILAFLFWRRGKARMAKGTLVIFIILFFGCTTAYLPCYLAGKLEDDFPVLNTAILDKNTHYYIHVLGSGNSLDERLPATGQLGLTALGRLCEAIRIYQQLPNCTIVTSANSPLGGESQASVTRRSAIELGVDPARISMLETPTNTREEAKSFRKDFGDTVRVIIATDAIHMNRAIKMFKESGLKPIAAPTNFRVKKEPKDKAMDWWPRLSNISLLDIYLHEVLGSIKMRFDR